MNVGAFVLELDKARSAISKAEENLESAMRGLCAAPRAEKVRISRGLEAAFSELRNARADLQRIQALIAEDLPKS